MTANTNANAAALQALAEGLSLAEREQALQASPCVYTYTSYAFGCAHCGNAIYFAAVGGKFNMNTVYTHLRAAHLPGGVVESDGRVSIGNAAEVWTGWSAKAALPRRNNADAEIAGGGFVRAVRFDV
ncbi:hypothetical protein HDZ31DRAFT_64881 [Schizophyllum fasciatum]